MYFHCEVTNLIYYHFFLALNVHFESQCIPTPLAWFAHQLPSWFLRFVTAFAILMETVVPFLFFMPVSAVRTLAFFLQVVSASCTMTVVLMAITLNHPNHSYINTSQCISYVFLFWFRYFCNSASFLLAITTFSTCSQSLSASLFLMTPSF